MKAIRRNLRLTDDAAAEVMQEIHGAIRVPLADAPASDCVLRPGHRDKNVLIALGIDFVALDVLLLLADERPCLIKLQALGADADHDAVIQFHAAKADAEGEVANGATVDAGQAGSGADADAFAKGSISATMRASCMFAGILQYHIVKAME